jgi:hypothetical protein
MSNFIYVLIQWNVLFFIPDTSKYILKGQRAHRLEEVVRTRRIMFRNLESAVIVLLARSMSKVFKVFILKANASIVGYDHWYDGAVLTEPFIPDDVPSVNLRSPVYSWTPIRQI